MKRNCLISLASSCISLCAQAAVPITSYEASAVEIPSEYAVQGGYWGLALGYNYLNTLHYDPKYVVDQDFDNLLSFPSEMTQSNRWGWDVMLTTGYRYKGWRFEAELGFRSNLGDALEGLPSMADIAEIGPMTTFNIPGDNLSDLSATTTEGTTTVLSLMFNVIYDRYYTTGWMWSIGFGAGPASLNFGVSRNPEDLYHPADYSNSSYDFKNTSITFAFQAILGIGYSWGDHLETAVSYRFFYPMQPHYDVTNDFLLGNQMTAPEFTVQFKPNYMAHTVNLEFRFT